MSDQTPTETPAPIEAPAEPVEQAAAVDPASDPAPEPDAADPAESSRISKLNRESARYRTERNELAQRIEAMETEQKSMVSNLAKALGLGGGEDEKSPEQIIEALTSERDAFATERDQYQQRLNDYRRADAIRAAAGLHKADPDALTDSRAFTDQVKELDLDAEDYADQVSAIVAQAVETNPRYKATPAVPPTSGTTPENSATPAHEPDGPAAWHAKRFGKR